jgi:hypothetical protein
MPDSYLVEVKPSVFSETSLKPADFDAVSNLSLSEEEFEGGLLMEFTSEEDAESWVQSYSPEIYTHRAGRLRLHSAHRDDGSDVDAYLLFKPRS